MHECGTCRERWEAEGALTEGMKSVRAAAWSQRSSAASRDFLMERFERVNRRRVAPRWYWALGAVAAGLIAAVVAPGVEHAFVDHAFVDHAFFNHAAETQAIAAAESNDTSDSNNSSEIRADAPADPEAEGFIAVPFVPPLAMGEMLRVVHTELNPAALASLGVSVDPSWTAKLPADVLLGEDGMPRAVRVSDSWSGSMPGDGGF
jgi:hypothetical protein